MQPATAPDVAPVPPPRRRGRIALVVFVILLLVAGAAVAYVIPRRDAKFSALPPACDTIRPLAAQLGTYELKPTQFDRGCELWLPKDHPAYVNAWKITVGFYAEVDDGGPAAPASVPEMMRDAATKAVPVAGLGDEAYQRDRNLYIRISNMMVVILVMPRPVSTEAQVNEFATALVATLDT